MLMRSFVVLLPIIVYTALVCGCATSSIVSIPLPEKLKTLKASEFAPTVSPRISISTDIPESLGPQFFLMFFPLGKTMTGDIEALTFDTVVKELLYSGYNLQLIPNSYTSTQLIVEVKEARMVTYDLIFTRLVHSEVALEITWQVVVPGGTAYISPPLLVREKRRSYLSLPFSRRMSKELQKTISQALKRGLSQPQLTTSHSFTRNP
jgi:hypothetical protein